MTRNIILVLAAVALLQSAAAARLPRNSIAEGEVEDTPRDKLWKFGVKEYSDLVTYTVDEISDTFEKVIAAVNKDKDKQLQEYNSKLIEFVAANNKIVDLPEDKRLEKRVDLFTGAIKLLQAYDSEESGFYYVEMLRMKQLFMENGFDELLVEFKKRFLSMSQRFETQVEAYIATLTDEQKVTDKKFANWLETLRKEQVLERRVHVLTQFFHLYEE